MEWVETTAKTIDEAKDEALDRLGVDEQDAEFEILEEPRPGLFGRMRGEARVRARVRPVQPRPKADRRDRRRKGGGKGGRSSGRSGSKGPAADVATEDSATEDPADDVLPSDDSSPDGSSPGDDATTDEPEPTGDQKRRSSRGRGRGRGNQRQGETPPGGASARRDEESTMSEDVTVEEQGEMIEEFLSGLVDAFGYDAEIQVTNVDEDTVEVSAEGDDLGLLVGSKGATLQAIHDLSRTVVQRQASGNHEGRVRIDVAGYREKRRGALERFTHKIAEQVLETGTEQVLEPMAPADRKVVHDTANTIDGVRTTSEGDEPRRRVVLLPDED